MVDLKEYKWLVYRIFCFYFLFFMNFFINIYLFNGFISVKILNYVIGYGLIPYIVCYNLFLYKDKVIASLFLFLNLLLSELFLTYLGHSSGYSTFLNFYFREYIIYIIFFLFFLIVIFGLYFFYKFDDSFKDVKIEFVKKKLKESKDEDVKLNNIKSELPLLSLLSSVEKKDIVIDINSQKKLLIEIFKDFGIDIQVKSVFIGPVITLYSIKLASGIKASRVIVLSNDIARLMFAYSVRISTIPGQNLLGIEISNPKRQVVYFKDGISSALYSNSSYNLPLYLGCNIFGEPEVFDLANMPHLLIAGTTGSGKSVCIHTLLLSLLYKKSFNDLKLILIDPKKLELTPYEDIPHLLTPVVTDCNKAIESVKWAVQEMEDRYNSMSKIGVRNILSYNDKITSFKNFTYNNEKYEYFPYIVIVIDEMADLMLVVQKEFEVYIQRLAQMGRAAGIHIIIATQRPSVDVITGTIKANFPTRISFKLASKIDSRTILGDVNGADQLLGAGDMLFLSNNGRILRIHSGFVSEEDVLNVVNYLRKQAKPNYVEFKDD